MDTKRSDFTRYMATQLDQPPIVYTVERERGWEVVLRLDGYYSEADAQAMADYHRDILHRSLGIVPERPNVQATNDEATRVTSATSDAKCPPYNGWVDHL